MPEDVPVESPKGFKEQLSRYSTVIKWLFKDSAWRFRRLFAVIIGAGLLGMSAQGWTIGLAIMYSKALQSGSAYTLGQYHFEPRTSISLLALVACVILFSLALSALMIYFSDSFVLRLRRRYEQLCGERVIKIIGTNLRFNTRSGEVVSYKDISKLIRTDSRYCGKAMGALSGIFVPLITFLGATAVLFYVNYLLTILIYCLLSVMAVFLFKVYVGAAKATVSKERYTSVASAEFKRVFTRIRNTLAPLPKDDGWMDRKLYGKGGIKNYGDAYGSRLRAGVNSQFVNNIFLSVIIFSMMMVLGASMILHGSGWDEMVIYIVALQYALNHLKKTSGQLTVLNKYYPMIKRYFDFVDLNPLTVPVGENAGRKYIVKASDDKVTGSLDSIEISSETKINIVSPIDANRYTLANIIDTVFNGEKNTSDEFLRDSALAFPMKGFLPTSLRDTLGFPDGYKEKDLRRDLEGTDFFERLKLRNLTALDKPVKPETIEGADSELLCCLSLIAAIRSGKKFIVVSTKCLSKIDEDRHDFFIQKLEPGQVFMKIQFHVSLQKLYKHSDWTFVVSDGKRVVGIGDAEWFLKNINEITSIPSLRGLTSEEEPEKKGKDKEDELLDELELEEDDEI